MICNGLRSNGIVFMYSAVMCCTDCTASIQEKVVCLFEEKKDVHLNGRQRCLLRSIFFVDLFFAGISCVKLVVGL